MLLTMLNLINVTDNVKFDVTDNVLLTMLNLINVTDNVKFDKCN